ncbi:MAG: hypothetical protein ACYC27_02645 [Armatimonadota bacterium]
MSERKNVVSRREFLTLTGAAMAVLPIIGSSDAHAESNEQKSDGGIKVHDYQIPTGEPYGFSGKRIVFTNWLLIRPGVFGWYDASGQNVTVTGKSAPKEAKMKRSEFPFGIRLEAQKAKRLGPIFKVEEPWEDPNPGFSTNTIIQDGSIYKAWGGGAYYESKDGITWERPRLGIKEINGSKENNHTNFDFSGGTVFIDPSAPSEERYKWVGGAGIEENQFDEWKQEHPDRWEPRAHRKDVKHVYGIGGAVSPDGLHWTRIPEPFVIEHSDTHITGYYDTILKKYVIYTRNYMIAPSAENYSDGVFRAWWDAGRRSIGRTESDNFKEFPVSDVILVPTPDMPPYDLLYTNCRTTISGAPDHHLMFPAVWHAALDDTTSHLIASSHDGKVWNYIPGGPVFDTPKSGKWDEGCQFALPNLIELPNGDFALPYNGYSVPHKYPRGQWKINMGYAVWPKGRIVALKAADKGEFSMVAFMPPGRKLRINAVTARGGSVLVEVTDISRNIFARRSFADCDPIIGDQYKTLVTWKGQEDLSFKNGEAISLRFKLEKASIYGLEFE